MNTGVYLLYKAHIRLLCCAVMPNPHRLSVGVSWVWPARRGRSSRLALPLGASPIGCSPIIIRPSRTRSPSFRCHSGAVAHSDVQGKHRVLRKHTHTHMRAKRRRLYQTPQTQSISREACAAADHSGHDRPPPPGWPTHSLSPSSLLFFYF